MNTFGTIFRTSIFGESHGPAVGIVIDGCPAGLPLDMEKMMFDIDRRRPGKKGTTSRKETDEPEFLSGILEGKTTGAPITMIFRNSNTQSKDYDELKKVPRPGHADMTAREKFGGNNDNRGGGHFSGRLTLPIVAAGYFAKTTLDLAKIEAKLISVGGEVDYQETLERAVEDEDSLGGIIECRVSNLPAGLGEPFFDSVESLISHAVFSIPGIKAIEFGAGFKCASMMGSQFNDPILDAAGKTSTNHCGGINGGITNGNELVFRVAVRPTASISKEQRSVNLETGEQTDLCIRGRHDACFALRVPVVVEAMTALVLADLLLMEGKVPRIF